MLHSHDSYTVVMCAKFRRDKISLWLEEYVLNQSNANFGRISNSIEISVVGRVPGLVALGRTWGVAAWFSLFIITISGAGRLKYNNEDHRIDIDLTLAPQIHI